MAALRSKVRTCVQTSDLAISTPMHNLDYDHVNVNFNMVGFVPKVNLQLQFNDLQYNTNTTKKRSYNKIVIMCVIMITITFAIYDHSFYKGILTVSFFFLSDYLLLLPQT